MRPRPNTDHTGRLITYEPEKLVLDTLKTLLTFLSMRFSAGTPAPYVRAGRGTHRGHAHVCRRRRLGWEGSAGAILSTGHDKIGHLRALARLRLHASTDGIACLRSSRRRAPAVDGRKPARGAAQDARAVGAGGIAKLPVWRVWKQAGRARHEPALPLRRRAAGGWTGTAWRGSWRWLLHFR